MIFDIITIFPQIFDSYFSESILKRAQKENFIKINIHNLRDYTNNKHRTVDDTPYGGGAGMVMMVEPILRAVSSIISNFQFPISKQFSNSNSKISKPKNTRIILFSAKGKRYTQQDAVRLSQYKNIIMICGRYEGVDERVAEHIADEEISIGDYVLTGGEIPAMTVIDSVSRLLPGVLGNKESIEQESHNEAGTLEHPQYTKPEEFFPEGQSASGENGWKVPEILLGGNHKEIEKWRNEKQKHR
ncbi:MAG: tRNA (guanosine(37)-N1)-methyltransferase TrmD [Candidatus Moranbacteria bacterium]|jgi:tRNA (guanine37-N1)-methyltransferase|nr:tRNA (guanosine(37)-N1)-methyltransferase TrmD [Candidatus Moranbacteria bacterium]